MKFLVDETSTPVGIRYPTEPNLLNEAREKIKEIIDVLQQPHRAISLSEGNVQAEEPQNAG